MGNKVDPEEAPPGYYAAESRGHSCYGCAFGSVWYCGRPGAKPSCVSTERRDGCDVKFYSKGPAEVLDLAKCVKMAKSAPKDHWGNRPPKGLVPGCGYGSPYPPKYGMGTPWPVLAQPYGFYSLPTWGVIITTKQDAEKRGLKPVC